MNKEPTAEEPRSDPGAEATPEPAGPTRSEQVRNTPEPRQPVHIPTAEELHGPAAEHD